MTFMKVNKVENIEYLVLAYSGVRPTICHSRAQSFTDNVNGIDMMH